MNAYNTVQSSWFTLTASKNLAKLAFKLTSCRQKKGHVGEYTILPRQSPEHLVKP